MTYMKHLALTLVLVPYFVFPSFGQNKPVESARVAFISQKINITPVQAEKFWPLYNEFNNQKKDIRKTIRAIYETIGQTSEPTMEGTKKNIEQIAALRQKEAGLEKEYYIKYLLILTPKQVADLISAEKEFQKMLIKKVSEE